MSEYSQFHEVLRVLPQMSHRITDDTIHEKVLSYLLSFVNQFSTGTLQHQFLAWDGLSILRECIHRDQDYRISSVAIRLLGRLVSTDGQDEELLHALLNVHHDILDYILSGLHFKEALLRFSCVDALEGIASSKIGFNWLLTSKEFSAVCKRGFEDESTYVVSATCKLLVAMVKHGEWDYSHSGIEPLNRTADIIHQIKEVIMPENANLQSHQHWLSALNFFWELVDSRTPGSYEFLHQSHLLASLNEHFLEPDKILRNRTLEIFTSILEHAPNPLLIIANKNDLDFDGEEEEKFLEAFCYSLDHLISKLFLNADFDSTVMAVRVLESLLHLSDRTPKYGYDINIGVMSASLYLLRTCIQDTRYQTMESILSDIPSTIIREKLYNCLYKCHVLHLSPDFNYPLLKKKSLISAILKTFLTVSFKSPKLIYVTNRQGEILHHLVSVVLQEKSLGSDMNILRPAIRLLNLGFQSVYNEQVGIKVRLVVPLILQLLQNKSIECAGITLILEVLGDFLLQENLSKIFCEQVKDFEIALQMRFQNPQWDIRDSIVGFVERLFESECHDAVRFALNAHLVDATVNALTDAGVYVRASAIKAICIISKNPLAPEYLAAQPLRDKMVEGLRDPEAFVRRAAVEWASSMIARGLGNTVEWIFEDEEKFLNQTLLRKLMDDQDWEVRQRVSQLLRAIWDYSLNAEQMYRQNSKRSKSDLTGTSGFETGENNREEITLHSAATWFYRLRCDELILFAVDDYARMVRLEVLHALQNILPSLDTLLSNITCSESSAQSIPLKRPADSAFEWLDMHHQSFRIRIREVDWNRLEKSTLVEHLYQEAVDDIDHPHVTVEENKEDTELASMMALMMDMQGEESEGEDDNWLDCY
ncbi:uncharacterized protein VTP21DRAFT_3351 [Calcarisporiella thermophila]|uniref:uncharacterized protein n=1 Tax=Calcarisporiella thermophila TaxID=911321 RepID=UPI00374273DC